MPCLQPVPLGAVTESCGAVRRFSQPIELQNANLPVRIFLVDYVRIQKRTMTSTSMALTIAALLTAISTANAWLGDNEQELIQRYGKPRLVELTTGDIPTQKGYYAELKENFSTNVSLIASTD